MSDEYRVCAILSYLRFWRRLRARYKDECVGLSRWHAFDVVLNRANFSTRNLEGYVRSDRTVASYSADLT